MKLLPHLTAHYQRRFPCISRQARALSHEASTAAIDVSLEGRSDERTLLAPPFLSLSVPGGGVLGVNLTDQGDALYRGTLIIVRIPERERWCQCCPPATRREIAELSSSGRSAGAGYGRTRSHVTAAGTFRDQARFGKSGGFEFHRRSFRGTEKDANDQPVPPVFEALIGASETPLVATVTPGVDAQTWSVVFPPLPPAAGQTPENLTLRFRAEDDFENVGTRIAVRSQFQVYQGTLPSLSAPGNLQAQALPAGEIKLSWTSVSGASGYRLYRKDAEQGTFGALLTEISTTEYTDLPPIDGTYWYAVTSLRDENGEIAESTRGDAANATSDRVPPAAPTGLELALQGRGLQASWVAAESCAGSDVPSLSLRLRSGSPQLVKDKVDTVVTIDPLLPAPNQTISSPPWTWPGMSHSAPS